MSGIEFKASDMTRDVHHDVTVRQEPPDDKETGIAAILNAFMRNPVAAVEVVMFIGGLYGLYYTLNTRVDEVKASSEAHYKDLAAQFMQGQKDVTIQIAGLSEKFGARMDVLQAADKAEVDDIRQLYTRGDQRYREILQKLNEHDVIYSKTQAGVEYIQRRLEEGRTFVPHDQRGEFGPRPSIAGIDR